MSSDIEDVYPQVFGVEHKDGFPDPNGALLRSIAISAANEKVARSEKRKRGVYTGLFGI